MISGRSESALRAQAARLHDHLGDLHDHLGDATANVLDVGLSLAGRPTFEHRAVVLGADRPELLNGLAAAARGEHLGGVVSGAAHAPNGQTAFLFAGQGSQQAGMGRALYGTFAVFREALDELCGELDPLLGRSLREVLFASESVSSVGQGGAGLLDRTLFTQTGLFALEVALYRLLESWGARPDFLMGHSIGELAAAYVAGVFSLQDACVLVAARGRLMGALPEGGAMVSIQAPVEEVAETLQGMEQQVSLAAVNGPRAVVISGDEDVVLRLADRWQEQGVKTKRLRVSHAFHSQRMDAMLDEFAEVARGLSFSAPRIPIVSNLTGEPAAAERLCSVDYWVQQVRAPVRFMEGVRWLRTQGVSRFLELGPRGVLSAMVEDCLDGWQGGQSGPVRPAADADGAMGAGPISVIPLLHSKRPEVDATLGALAELWVSGAAVDWGSLFAGSAARRVSLPTYAFQRERFWLAGDSLGEQVGVGQSAVEHPLLDAMVGWADGERWLFAGRLSPKRHPWLVDHAMLGEVLLAGTAFLELALCAGERVGCEAVRELVLEAPLVFAGDEAVLVQLLVGEDDGTGERPFSIHSRADRRTAGEDPSAREAWTRHATGFLTPTQAASNGHSVALRERAGASLGDGVWPPRDARKIDLNGLYDALAVRGFEYGPAFQGLRAAWQRGEELFAEVALPASGGDGERWTFRDAPGSAGRRVPRMAERADRGRRCR